MTPRFPNLFMLDGPQSPAAFFSPPLLADYQIQLVAGMIRRLDEARTATLEPTDALARDWTRQVDVIASASLLPKADSWWFGANIPGKRRQALYFLGGFPAYKASTTQILDSGFAGFLLDGEPVETPAVSPLALEIP